MNTIREILGKVEQIECREAVWRKVIEVLTIHFLSRDSTEAAQKVMLDSGAVVNEAYITAIIEIIEKEHIGELEKQKDTLLNTNIAPTPKQLRGKK